MNVLILIALAYFAAVLILAQRRAPAAYSPRRHTISQLASQGYPRKRLMQAGFLIYGAMFTLALATIMIDSRAPIVRDLPHLVYGLALAPTGVFCSIPFLRGKRFSRREARIHAISAQVSGAAFGLGIAVHALLATGGAVRTFHLVSLLVYVAGAVWFARTRRRMGMAQRLMYAYGSVWLLATYGTGVFL